MRTTSIKLDRGLERDALFECHRLGQRGFGGIEVGDVG